MVLEASEGFIVCLACLTSKPRAPSGHCTNECARAGPNMVTRMISLTAIGNRTLILQSVASNVIDSAIRTMTDEEFHVPQPAKCTSLENIICSVCLPVSVCLCIYLCMCIYLSVCVSICQSVRLTLPVSLKRRLVEMLGKYKKIFLLRHCSCKTIDLPISKTRKNEPPY